jgi:hypothetical protein
VFDLVKSLPPIFYEDVRLIPKIMASNERSGIVIQMQSDIITDICRGQTFTVEIKKKLEKATAGYTLLQKHYASYMTCCLVYEKVQNCLLATTECPATTKKCF